MVPLLLKISSAYAVLPGYAVPKTLVKPAKEIVIADLPQPSLIEIVAPLPGLPNKERTAESFMLILAVADRPSSVFTCDSDIVLPDPGSAMIMPQ
jgi:hypothetical protein